MTRGHALERVCDEIAGPPLRLGAGLVFEHAHASGEVVARELFAALEQVRLRVLQGHAGNPLELFLLRHLFLLELLLKLTEMGLPVGDPLVLPLEVDELPLDLLFLAEHALLDLQDGATPVGELGVDLAPELDGLLARLDLRLATDGLRLTLCILDQLPAHAAGLADAGGAEDLDREQSERRACRYPDGDCDPDQHLRRTSLGWVLAHPASGPQARFSNRSIPGAQPARAPARGACQDAVGFGGLRFELVVNGVVTGSTIRKSAVCRQNVR